MRYRVIRNDVGAHSPTSWTAELKPGDIITGRSDGHALSYTVSGPDSTGQPCTRENSIPLRDLEPVGDDLPKLSDLLDSEVVEDVEFRGGQVVLTMESVKIRLTVAAATVEEMKSSPVEIA